MKSKDIQDIVLSKYRNGDTPTKIFRDLSGGVGLATVKRWCQMIRQYGSIKLSSPPGRLRIARTSENIRKNERVWAVDRADADKRGGIKHKRKFPQKVMVWLGVCSQGITPLVIFDEETVDHACYIEKVLPEALEYGNKVFGNDWIFQQDGAKPHQHYLTQQWCRNSFPSFIHKDCWPPNSPDLNPLDYSIWDELANAIDWNKVKSKSALIQQLNSSVKGSIRLEKLILN
ncbi:unnamed protein product [Rotaria magnacalcarata]|uniref:Uncharacterized protein n=1 Tax=Rotaria magnacalcarata TaxID=392030 RepID=A0A816QTP7_9BILA|nr:unnamed protein product [Rotaria magnacalcarata]